MHRTPTVAKLGRNSSVKDVITPTLSLEEKRPNYPLTASVPLALRYSFISMVSQPSRDDDPADVPPGNSSYLSRVNALNR